MLADKLDGAVMGIADWFRNRPPAPTMADVGSVVALQAFFDLEKKVLEIYEDSGPVPEDRDPFEATYFSLVVCVMAIGVMGDRAKNSTLTERADSFAVAQLAMMKKGGAIRPERRFRDRYGEYVPLLFEDFKGPADMKHADAVARILNRHMGQQMGAPGIYHDQLQQAYRREATIVSSAYR